LTGVKKDGKGPEQAEIEFHVVVFVFCGANLRVGWGDV
jgi:hypothetical protein